MHNFRKKIITTRERIVYIQRVYQRHVWLKDAKLGLLENLWDREFKFLMKQANTSKDKKLKENIKLLIGIPDKVKKDFLLAYYKRCENKHALAFF